jgi:PAS domain S-box-containing protein
MAAPDGAPAPNVTDIPGQEPDDGLFGVLAETSDDAVFLCDATARIATWSTAAVRLFGHPAPNALGRPFHFLFPDHLRSQVRVVLAAVAAGDRVRHFESEGLRPDEMPVPVSLSLSPFADPARGSVVVVVARDVTEQHLAQATLAEVEARLEEGESLSHVGSWLWDVRTGAVQWSAELHRINGVDPLDFDGTFESHLRAVHPADRDRVRTAMDESVRAGRPFTAEYRIVRPDGEGRVLRVRAQPTVGSAGTTVGLRGIGQDVTDRTDADVSPGPPTV